MTRWLRNSVFAVLVIVFVFTVVNNIQSLCAKQTSLASSYGLEPLLPFPSVTICAHKRMSDNDIFAKENHLMFLKHAFMADNG